MKKGKYFSVILFITILSTFALVVRSANKQIDPAKANNNQQTKAFDLVVIDPGHGAEKFGAVGALSKEKDIVLDVSKKLKDSIEKNIPGVKVMLTRYSDIDVPFYERTALANKNHADLFISIHCNSADSDRRVRGKNGKYYNQVVRRPSVKGTETFVCGFNRLGQQDVAVRENADILLEDNYKENYNGFDPNDPSTYIVFSLMKKQYRNQSIKFAQYIQNEYIASKRESRGVQEQSLAVLATAGMPAVLTEIGFISNPEEEKFMLSAKGQGEIVTNLVTAIKHFKASMER